MSPAPVSEDLAHDAHLRAALRHAPDHSLSPPSGLSQTILAAARHAHQPVRSSAAPPPVRMRLAGSRGLSRWLQRLFAPRWAGAWAAGLVAALGLGLWLDLGVQPVLERSEAVAMDNAALPASPSTDAARAPTTSGDAATGDARAAASLAKAAPRAPAPAPAVQRTPTTATPGTTAPMAGARSAERTSEQRKEMANATQRRATAMSPPAETAVRQQAAAAEPTAQGAIVAAAPPGAQPADRVAALRADAVTPQRAAAPPATAAPRVNEQPPATGALESGAAPAPRQAKEAALSEAVAAASPALTLLRRAQAELASGGARWTWAAPGAATMAPFDDAAQAWLSRVVQAAAGRWVEVNERGEALGALEVRWWRDGWPHATLRLEAEGLRWIEPSGRIRYAALDSATVQRLRSF